jgi:competence protein ComEC
MAAAGIAHVLSVSGLHLTIVAGGTYTVLRLLLALAGPFATRLPVKQLAAVGGMVTAVLYYTISGSNIAALRSTIMILLVLGAVVLGRQALTMRNVTIAALLIIVTDPAGVFRPSFQLSFAAVVGLIGAWELMSRRARDDGPPRPRLVRYLFGILSTSLIAGAATLPFSVYHFQQTSPLGVLGNLAVLPLVGFVIMPAALLGTLAMPLGIEQPILRVMGWAIEWMLHLAAIVADWSAALSASPLLTPLALLLTLGAFAWFAFLSTWHRLIAPVLLIPAILLLALDRPPDLLISDTTQALAMRGASGLELVAGKAGSFAVDVWQDTYGEEIAAKSDMLACDPIGCFGQSPRGFVLALVADPAAFYEDCAAADVVVTRLHAPASCRTPVVIDAGDLQRRGIHWLRWDAANRRFDVRTAIPPSDRPWRVRPP